ncbi:MAG: hypothetical protein ACOC2Q_04065 [Spirochaetota bacterium]
METIVLASVCALALVVSAIRDRKRTLHALKIAWRRFFALLPSLLTVVAAVALVLTLVQPEAITTYLGGENTAWATTVAAAVGSITLMPGFIAYPLAGILRSQGVAYTVLSAFTATLMMVGVLTFPIEKQYFGVKLTIVRNGISLAIALVVAIVTGLYFGEIL